MCGRFALKALPGELAARFGLTEYIDFSPRYNISPGTDIPVIRRSPDGQRVLHLLRWGLIPHWSRDPGIGNKLANARGETVADKPAFRDAFRRRRCLVPVDGFYEWKADGRIKQPYYFSLVSGKPMALGALWESWKTPDGSLLRTVCLMTTAASALMEPIHDRMPVILAPEHWQDWFEAPEETISHLIAPYAGDDLRVWPVDRRVSRTTEEGESLIAPLASD